MKVLLLFISITLTYLIVINTSKFIKSQDYVTKDKIDLSYLEAKKVITDFKSDNKYKKEIVTHVTLNNNFFYFTKKIDTLEISYYHSSD